MNNYKIVVIANGDAAQAENAGVAAVAGIKAAGHTVISARLSVDEGGETDLDPAPPAEPAA